MEQYIFSDEQRSLLERMRVPFAVYQYIDGRIVTLLLSEGYRKLFGYESLETAYRDMGHDVYMLAHPDDVLRVSDVVFRFENDDAEYDVIYRTRTKNDPEYRIIHAFGAHVEEKPGVRLDYVWYTDEGAYTEKTDGKETLLNRTLNNALHEESILKASRYDYLTGLPSMTYFFELNEAGKAAIRRGGGQPALLYMNLGGMKFFNHKYTFSMGDKLLKEFSALLSRTFGNENCCHIAQDHFAVLTAAEGLEATLERLFRANAALNGGNSLPVRVGVYPYSTEDVAVSSACDRAKIACDALSKTYGSAFNYYNNELREDIKRRQYIQANIDRAIAEKWIQVYYQPIIRAANGKICGDEALARWIDPEEGMLSPADFIPQLEDSGQIYKLDLHVLEQVLEKQRILREAGYRVVPHSVNLSRVDFDACDIVEEIRSRVDAAGGNRALIAIEITESTIGSDFERMKGQIARFRQLGFPVWLDDFGSGYSSLDALQSIRFDLIKFDMSFMRKLGESESSRIVLTELVKLATSLGAETICEGVETERQVQFLQEIGCSMLQGFYFGKPLPLARIMERFGNPRIGYENPKEAPYYEAIGKVNLYDLAVIGNETEDGFQNFFDTLPMGIIEVRGNTTRFVRSNKSYRDFVKRFLGFDLAREGTDFMPYDDDFVENVVKSCCELGIKSFYDQQMPNGTVVHSIAKRIAVNPVSGTTAVAVAVLSISRADEGATYASIARALAADYYNIYYVDLDTEHFIEYSSPAGREGIAVERHGEQFFAATLQAAEARIYAEDRAAFLSSFTKENIIRALDAHGVFTTSYRLIDSGTPVYAGMKVTRMQPGGNQIIIGISIIDAQVKQNREKESTRQEQIALGRIAALSGECIAAFSVDPESGRYIEYSASEDYEEYGLAKTGDDFFEKLRTESPKHVDAADLPTYMRQIGKENMMREIRRSGIFAIDYHLILNGRSTPVSLRAALVRESGNEKLIVGIDRAHKPKDLMGAQIKERFQSAVDQMIKPSAILSVEKAPDGTVGEVRIVCANKEYKYAMGSRYYDNMPYYELVPRVLQFEYSCYRCAFQHQQIHTYVQAKGSGLWTDQQLIPLHSDREDIGYCQFVLELSETRNRELMGAVSMRTASVVLRAAITLLGTNDLKERVELVLKDIMEFSEAFSVRVMLADHENRRAINYCDVMKIELPADYTPPEDDPDQAIISYKLICSWAETLGDSNYLVVTTKREMDELEPRNPAWVRTMRAYDVTTLVLIPLRHDREIIGYLYLCNFNPEKVTEVRELSELMSFFLGTEIYNEVLLQRLDEMSRTDALTGLNNRNAMIQRTNRIAQGEGGGTFGVVNLDLNGLKTVNDIQGHDAGDRLLVSASEMLKKFFYAGDLYRTGGDEFIVIATNITREAFERKVERLREATGKNGDVSFAIGAFWSDGATDLLTAFRKADAAMYEDKKAFYDANPDRKR